MDFDFNGFTTITPPRPKVSVELRKQFECAKRYIGSKSSTKNVAIAVANYIQTYFKHTEIKNMQIAVLGQNGIGKSSFIEAVIDALAETTKTPIQEVDKHNLINTNGTPIWSLYKSQTGALNIIVMDASLLSERPNIATEDKPTITFIEHLPEEFQINKQMVMEITPLQPYFFFSLFSQKPRRIDLYTKAITL